MSVANDSAPGAMGNRAVAPAWSDSVIDLDAVRAATVNRDPYPHVIGSGVLRGATIPSLRSDFPDIDKPGFLTVDEVALRGRFRQMVEEIESPEFSEVMSRLFGVDLHPYPRLTTIRKLSQLKDGRPHQDGTAKVMTALFYLNDDWSDDGAGRLRVLHGPKGFEPYTLEVPPTMGWMFAFLRSDRSWHGHPPYAGVRKVVQTAWVKDEGERQRKMKRNATAQFFKGIFGR